MSFALPRGWLSLLLTTLLSSSAPAAEPDTIPLKFFNLHVSDVLRAYQQFSGLDVQRRGKIDGTLSVWARTDVSKAKAVELIEESLFSSGYMLMDTEPGSVQVFRFAWQMGIQKVPVISKRADLPSSERVVRYVYLLNKRDPKELAALLTKVVPKRLSGLPTFGVREKERAIFITESTSSLRNILDLVDHLDRP